MKIAIVGSGAIGCYYGGRLFEHGADVRFLMRSDYDAVKERGLTIHSGGKTICLNPVAAFRETAEIGPVDLVIISLKSTSNEALPKLMPPLIHDSTALLTIQNGLGNEEFLASHFGESRILGGVCFVGLNRIGQGVINHIGGGSLMIGEFHRSPTPRAQDIAALFTRSEVPSKVVVSLGELRWRKLVWNIPFNGLSIALGGVTTDIIMANPENRQRAIALMKEIIAAAQAQGYQLDESYIEHELERTPPLGAYHPSSLLDWQAGRPVELECIWGEALRRGQAAGVKMPELEALYHQLKSMCHPPR